MRGLILSIAVVVEVGCAGGMDLSRYSSPDGLLTASEQRFRRGDCKNALLGFRQLTFQLPPRDPMAIRARFFLAECHFAGGDYLEAARQFRRVSDEAPDHELAPNALLRAGDAQAELWKRPELDPTYGEAALATYRELLARFPGTPAARRSALRLRELNRLFAEKEYKNGVFYLRLKAYDSAILYFKKVIAAYGESTYAADAVIRLVDIYDRLHYEEERQEMCDHLRAFYPDARGADDRCPVVVGSP